MRDCYDWFDPHQVREWLYEADDRLYYESREYKGQHERDQRELAYYRARCEALMDALAKVHSMMPLPPIFVRKDAVSQ